jgi:aspartokinase/homoserine dehydrogenase 1
VYLAGTGVVGGRLLGLLATHRESLLKTRRIDLHVRGIANNRRMAFDDRDALPARWTERLANHGLPSDLNAFVQHMFGADLPNKVFVDCTASDEPVALYGRILSAGIPVVASNKRANAGPQSLYDRLHATAAARATGFLYETNVGAGLPVLKTVNDLIAGGDRILRIEGVLSGTLSYLFNADTPGLRFSEIVRAAQEKGYTEPDPREDLNGIDVGRKLLILAREAGSRLEFRDIRIDSLVPRSMLRAPTVAAFMKDLHRLDAGFVARLAQASRRGKKLRHIASYAAGRASVGLREVGPDHPAYALRGSEVAIILTTTFCREQPVIIRGPGAGADVTAAGVLADIIHLAREH